MSFRKRNRQTIVCRACRVKKTKCDRGMPCSACAKAGTPQECHYSFSKDSNNDLPPFEYGPGHRLEETEHQALYNELRMLKQKLKELEETGVAQEPTPPNNIYAMPLSVTTLSGRPSFLGSADPVGLNPICLSEDVFNFHYDVDTGTKADVYALKVVHLLSVGRRDPGAALFWNSKAKKQKPFNFNSINAGCLRDAKTVSSDLVDLVRTRYGDNYVPYTENYHTQPNLPDVNRAISGYGLHLGYAISQVYSDGDPLEIAAAKLLPPKDFLFGLLEVFFTNIYLFFPIVDETQLLSDINRIVQYTPAGIKVKFSNKIDIAVLAILVLILRLAHVSLFTNNVQKNAALFLTEPLLSFPIPLDCMKLATRCLKEFDFVKINSLTVLQAMILMHICKEYYPEYGHDTNGNELQMGLAILIQTACSLGLNRDPDYYPDSTASEAIKHLKRKIWFFVLYSDRLLSLECPSTISIRLSDYDTKLPYYVDESNAVRATVERDVVKSFEILSTVYPLTSQLLGYVVDVNTKIRVNDLLLALTSLETFTLKTFGRAKDYITRPTAGDAFLKVFKFRTYYQIKTFTAYLYHFLHLVYEKKGETNLDHFFLRKLLVILFSELRPLGGKLFDHCDAFFGLAFLLIMSPIAGLYGHQLGIVSLGLCIRLVCSMKFLDREDPLFNLLYGVLQKFVKTIYEHTRLILRMLRCLGTRYIFAWKCRKAHASGYDFLDRSDQYLADDHAAKSAAFNFTVTQYKELDGAFTKTTTSLPSDEDEDSVPMTPTNLADANPLDVKLVDSIQRDNFMLQIHGWKMDAESVVLVHHEPNHTQTFPATPEYNDLLNTNWGLSDFFPSDFNYAI